jgi:hypothetical protein
MFGTLLALIEVRLHVPLPFTEVKLKQFATRPDLAGALFLYFRSPGLGFSSNLSSIARNQKWLPEHQCLIISQL